jgi:hypothetical protein
MSKVNSIKFMFVSGLFAAVSSLSILMSPNVMAVSCSGSGCTGKNPATTGCSKNASLIRRYYFANSNTGISYIYPNDIELDVYYSYSCGTNWIRVTKNPFGGLTRKNLSLVSSKTSILVENDYGYGASYSMQVYAPGTTRIAFSSYLYDTAGRLKAYVLTQYL